MKVRFDILQAFFRLITVVQRLVREGLSRHHNVSSISLFTVSFFLAESNERFGTKSREWEFLRTGVASFSPSIRWVLRQSLITSSFLTICSQINATLATIFLSFKQHFYRCWKFMFPLNQVHLVMAHKKGFINISISLYILDNNCFSMTLKWFSIGEYKYNNPTEVRIFAITHIVLQWQ